MNLPKYVFDDDELMRLSSENEGCRIEREPDGTLTVSPANYRNAVRAAEVCRQLHAWGHERGWAAASDGGVTLPDKAVRAPDASWISFERWETLSENEREKYAAVVPDVVVEIVSPSDRYAQQRAKTKRYVEQGARYAVVIDPRKRRVEAFGTPPEGLVFDYDRIFEAGIRRAKADGEQGGTTPG